LIPNGICIQLSQY